MQGVEVNNKSCEEFIWPERIWLEPGGGKMGAESGPHSTESQERDSTQYKQSEISEQMEGH